MSKPNLLGFSSSLGIYRNKRIRDLCDILSKELPGKVPFAAMSPMLFQIVMAYAGENQINGDFSDYTPKDFVGIFATNYVTVSVSEAKLIREAFETVGLFQEGKIRSWLKFNRHLADYDSIVRAKRLAGKLSAKKRHQDARESLKKEQKIAQNGDENDEKTAQNGEKKRGKTVQKDEGITKQIYLLNQSIDAAKTPKAKAALNRQKAELLAAHHGVDLSAPSPARSAPAVEPRKRSQAEIESDQLRMAQTCLQDYPDGLNESMVRALVQAGQRLPTEVQSRFRKLIAQLNPVPE